MSEKIDLREHLGYQASAEEGVGKAGPATTVELLIYLPSGPLVTFAEKNLTIV